MRIKMISLMAGPAGTREPGKQYTVPEDEGRMLVAAGAAVDMTPAVKVPAAGAAPASPPRELPAGSDPATRRKWIEDVARLAAVAGVDMARALTEAESIADAVDADPDMTAPEPVDAARQIVDRVKPTKVERPAGARGNERATGKGQRGKGNRA